MIELVVTAGVGPVEVRAFVAQLANALADACRDAGAVVVDVVTVGDPPASVGLTVRGPVPRGWTGTHALVDPVRGKGRRRRWYAGVCAVDRPPVPPVDVARDDVEITAMRSGGPGGQHVNTSSTAVRAVHRPTGIAVRSDGERSQHANRRRALVRLGAVLAARAADAAARRQGARRALHHQLVRGAPVRTWRRDASGALIPATPPPTTPRGSARASGDRG